MKRSQPVRQSDLMLEMAKADALAAIDYEDGRVSQLMFDGMDQPAAERQAARELMAGRRPE